MSDLRPVTDSAALWFGVYGFLLALGSPRLLFLHEPTAMFTWTFFCLVVCVVGLTWRLCSVTTRLAGWGPGTLGLACAFALALTCPNVAVLVPVHGFLLMGGGILVGRFLGQHWTIHPSLASGARRDEL